MAKRVLVGMSGGVDSSVTALLLQRAGYEVIGCTMRLHCAEEEGALPPGSCCSLDDVDDARRVARGLGCEHYVLNFKDEFRSKVIDKFCNSYLTGLTPNPCIDCNRYMKFGLMMRRARELDCDFVATGHYARITHDEGGYHLLRGLDPKKDQSYVLYHLNQNTLAHMLFPLGGLTKPEVRALAEEAGLRTANKQESQDICFVPDGDYAGFIKANGGQCEPGDFLDAAGNVLGRHKGLMHYTVGQRKGIGLGGGTGEPLYVVGKNPSENTVTVGGKELLTMSRAIANDVSKTAGLERFENLEVTAKANYRQAPKPALASFDGETLTVDFQEAQRPSSPGQSLVVYRGDEVICGGTILSCS